MIFNRKKYSMSKQEANNMLNNVLAACNIDSENINFDLLILKSIAQTTLIDTCKWIAIGFLFLILISPVVLINNEMKIESRGIANERIIIRNHQLYSDHFVLELAGEDIAYDEIYARNAGGDVIFPTSIDEASGHVEFPYSSEALTIFIPDIHGHTLNASLSAYDPEKKQNEQNDIDKVVKDDESITDE